jgi:hypothetical protein
MRLKALVIDPQDGSLAFVETPWTTVELLAPVDTETKSANHREGDYPNVEQSHPCLGHPDADGGHTAPRPSLFGLAPPTPCANRVQTALATSYGYADALDAHWCPTASTACPALIVAPCP